LFNRSRNKRARLLIEICPGTPPGLFIFFDLKNMLLFDCILEEMCDTFGLEFLLAR